MRARRVAFFGLMGLSLFALLYTGELLYLWVIFFQLSILFVSCINLLITFVKIVFVQEVTPLHVVKGETATLRLEVHNETIILPFAHLTLTYSTPETTYNGYEHHFSASLLPRQRESVETPIQCKYRGEYRFGFDRITATDLFGLISVSFPFSVFTSYEHVRLLVYPRIRPILPGSLVNRERDGLTDSPYARAEELSSIADIRAHREGDPLKRVHWKLSARNRKLLVKEFEGSLSADSFILVDCTAHPYKGEYAAKFEDTIVECATAFAKRMTEDFQPVTMYTYSDKRMEISGSSSVDFPAFYDLLCRIRFQGDLSLASAIKLEWTRLGNLGSLVIISQTPSDELYEVLTTLADSGCRITLAAVVSEDMTDEHIVRMLGDLSLRGVHSFALFPGEDISLRLGGVGWSS